MDSKGFTLIELVVTISILCILLALAVLVIDRDMFYMEKMADEFVMDARYVQMQCMKNASDAHKIIIDIDNGCYYIYNSTVVEKTVVFKSRYHIDYSNKNTKSIGFTFTFEGIPVNAGTFKIVDGRTNRIKEISIVPATGRTVIKE